MATEPVRLVMDDQEAHDVHHALSVAVTLLREVGAQPGAPLTAESEQRLLIVARRLDHERRWKGSRPNPNVAERWRAENFDVSVIVGTLDKLYVETPGTHPFVMKMQEVNPVDLVEHVLHEAEKQIVVPTDERRPA